MVPRKLRPRLLVAGLGNLILRDDGVGVHAVRLLKARLPRRVMRAEVGTAVLDALHLVERADRIIALDAIEAGREPGSIHLLDGRSARAPSTGSLHALDLLSVLRFLPDHQPEIVVLGAEPETIDFGMDLTARVAASLPQLVQAAARLAAMWEAQPGLTAAEMCRKAAG